MRDNWMDAECICLASDGVRTSGVNLPPFSIKERREVNRRKRRAIKKARRFHFVRYFTGELLRALWAKRGFTGKALKV